MNITKKSALSRISVGVVASHYVLANSYTNKLMFPLCSGVPQNPDEIRERALFFLNIHYDAVK